MSNTFNLDDLKNATNVEDLHNYGDLDEIIKIIQKDPCMCSRSILSWDDAFSVINELKRFDSIFVSDNAKYIFALIYLEGKTRNQFIALTDDLYYDKEKADKWFKVLCKKIHPDYNKNIQDFAQKAFIKLQELYSRIMECFSDEKEV